MGDQIPNIVPREVIALHNFYSYVRHALDRDFKDRLSILMEVVHLPVHRVVGSRIKTTAPQHTQRLPTSTIYIQFGIYETIPLIVRFQQHTSRSITKEHTCLSIRVVRDAAHLVRTYHQYLCCPTTLNQSGPCIKRKKKAAACSRQIKPPGSCRAEFSLNQTGCRRKRHIRCHCSNNYCIKLFGGYAPFQQNLPSSTGCHVGGSFTLAREYATLLDTCP